MNCITHMLNMLGGIKAILLLSAISDGCPLNYFWWFYKFMIAVIFFLFYKIMIVED